MINRGKKILFLTLALVMTLVLATGCKENSGMTSKEVIDIANKSADMENVDTIVGNGDMIYEDSFKELYGMEIDEIEDGVIAYSETGGLADEISIIRVKDDSDKRKIEQAMQSRLEKRRQVFNGYKPKEIRKIDAAKVMVYKDYVALIISEQAQEIELAIKEAINTKQ